MTNDNRLLWLDAVKGIGIMLIMIVHIYTLPFDKQFLIAGYVSMFFVASGLTMKPMTDISSSIYKKAKRLLIPYFFYTSIIVVLSFIIALSLGNDYNIRNSILGILYSKYCLAPIHRPDDPFLLSGANAPAWFLTSLFTSYLFVFLWQKLRQSKILLVIYLLTAILATRLPVFLPWSIDMAPLGALLIITGFKAKDTLITSKYDKWVVLVLFFYIGIVYLNGKTNMSLRKYGEMGISSTFLFYIIGVLEFWLWSVLCRFTESTLFVRILAYIGRNSLRLMCIHMFICHVVRDVIVKPLGYEWSLMSVLVSLCLIFLFNHIINKLCDRYNNSLSLLKYI